MSDTSTQATVRQFTMEEVGATWQSAAHALTREGRWAEARAVIDRALKGAGTVARFEMQDAANAVREAVNLAEMTTAGVVNQTVRERSIYGGQCTVLGAYQREDATAFVYTCAESGRTKRAKRDAKRKHRGAAPAPHAVPCRSCPDHPETLHPVDQDGRALACIHGVRHGGHCERCLSG